MDSDSDSGTSSNASSSNSSDSDTSLEDSSDSRDLLLDTEEKEYLDSFIEINFVKKKEPPTSIATVKYKIKPLNISAIKLDSKAKSSIVTENIVDHIKAKINKSETHDFSNITTVLIKSIGVVYNLSITLDLGLIIYEDFVVIRYNKPTLIFSNQLLKKYNCTVN
ncbi:10649_t:CDS:2 [Cetraspora pellucida]|uniref:10649_t:CDS:1 n=1 Tax=Cetraspora pellucida TaxID=1433469 RepID=A0A9N9D2E0_9GLOM|nr:10649_t:CDS:2 [Cetraspora pellucida]